MLTHSLRGNYSLDQLLQTALPFTQLSALLMPELAGGQRQWAVFPYVGAINYYETTCYAGVAAAFFGAMSLRARRRSPGPGGLVLGWRGPAGDTGRLRLPGLKTNALFYAVPLFKSFHGVARTLVTTDLAIAVLCAFGVQGVIDSQAIDRAVLKRSTVRAAGVVALVIIGLYGIAASRTSGEMPLLLTHEWLGYGLNNLPALWRLPPWPRFV